MGENFILYYGYALDWPYSFRSFGHCCRVLLLCAELLKRMRRPMIPREKCRRVKELGAVPTMLMTPQ